MLLGILLLAFISILFLIMLASIWFVNFMTRRYIGEKHHDLEEITNSGSVPQHWSTPYVLKMNELDQKGEAKGKIIKVQKKANKKYIRKINKLIQYMNKTRLVDDENTRKQLLHQLKNLRQQQIEGS